MLWYILLLHIFGPYDPTNFTQFKVKHYVVIEAYRGREDLTDYYVKNETFCKFYSIGKGPDSVYFANIVLKRHSQSFGKISNVERYDDFYEGYKMEITVFDWAYHNTYDGKSGTASVRLIEMPGKDYTGFGLIIKPEGRPGLYYRGYVAHVNDGF